MLREGSPIRDDVDVNFDNAIDNRERSCGVVVLKPRRLQVGESTEMIDARMPRLLSSVVDQVQNFQQYLVLFVLAADGKLTCFLSRRNMMFREKS